MTMTVEWADLDLGGGDRAALFLPRNRMPGDTRATRADQPRVFGLLA